MRERVLAAAERQLLRDGYEGMSMSAIAEEAGVARTTIYRRWPTRAALVAELATALNATWVPEPAPGPLREQLRAIAEQIRVTLTDPLTAPVVQALLAIAPADAAHVRETLQAARADVYDRMLTDARDRGEQVPRTVDGWSLVEAIIAPIWMRRFISGLPITDRVLDQLVERAMRGAGIPVGD